MDDLETKLGNVLSNPELMQQIMSMAQSLGQSPPPESPPKSHSGNPGDLNPAMLAQLVGFASQTGVDKNQQQLLSALSPYLPGHRIQKLEKAMRAAKLAHFASEALQQSKL